MPLQSIPENVELTSIIGNVDNGGGRVIIRGNDLRETRSQGVLVQTSHVVVENNLIQGTGGPAIKLNLALEDWYEAINTNNVLLQNNSFQRTSQSVAKTNEIIHVYQRDRTDNEVDIIDNVTIIGNTLLDGDDAPPDVSNSFPNTELIYLNKEPSVQTTEVEAQIELYNRDSTELDLVNTEIRYFLDPDGLTPVVSVLSTNVPGSGLTAEFVADESLVRFTLTDNFLVEQDERLKIRFAVTNEENLEFDQSNDYSFIETQTIRNVTDRIAVVFPYQTTSDSISVGIGDLASGVAVDDHATGVGYLMYSSESVFNRFPDYPPHRHNSDHVIAVRLHEGNWQYSDNERWYPMTVHPDDRLLARIDFGSGTVDSLAEATGQLAGVSYGYIDGDLSFFADQWNGQFNQGEYSVAGSFFNAWTEQDTRPVTPIGQLNLGVAVADDASGIGYLLYSPEEVHTRFAANRPLSTNSDHILAVRYENDQWQYNDNRSWINFSPHAGDTLLAEVDYDRNSIVSLLGMPGQVGGIKARLFNR